MKSKYLIKLKGSHQDLLRISRDFSTIEHEVIQENHVFYLISPDFDLHTDDYEAYKLSIEVIKNMNFYASLAYGINIEIFPESVYEVQEDGTRVGYIYISGTAEIGGHTRVCITELKGSQVINSNAEKFKNWSKLKDDENVKRVREFFKNQNWGNLYRIYEIIERECGDKIYQNSWASKKQTTLFNRTANSPDAIGSDARHGVQKNDPPSKPMSLQDAQSLIRHIIQQWLDWKCKL